ncbi:hypothetical protein CIB48_g1778 [Xylaria polymorpha]|nr:hypothetical protein CIB48_g1778 [Xylaria polymorpha]
MECLVNGDLPSHGMQAKVNLLLGDLTAIGLKQIVECDQSLQGYCTVPALLYVPVRSMSPGSRAKPRDKLTCLASRGSRTPADTYKILNTRTYYVIGNVYGYLYTTCVLLLQRVPYTHVGARYATTGPLIWGHRHSRMHNAGGLRTGALHPNMGRYESNVSCRQPAAPAMIGHGPHTSLTIGRFLTRHGKGALNPVARNS